MKFFCRVALVLILVLFVGCSKKYPKSTACERGLNIERLTSVLISLPENTTIRETTNNYYSETRDRKRSYLVRSLIQEKTKSTFVNESWLTRHKFYQNCSLKQVTSSDGFVWDINSSSENSISISLENFGDVMVTFTKNTDTSFSVTQRSRSNSLNSFFQTSTFRWGQKGQDHEDLDIDFIFGLYDEGVEIPTNILESYGERSPGQQTLSVSIEDIYNLQEQIDKILGR